MKLKTYRNSTELARLGGVPIYMQDMVDACLRAKLNLFLQGDTGSGKTQLAADAMSRFGHTVGDGKFAKEMQEQYRERLDEKASAALEAARGFSDDRTLFVLGRNDMDTRELFRRLNIGKLNQKPAYTLEPLVNPESGEVVWHYPKVDEKGIVVYQKLDKTQADRVRRTLESLAGTTDDIKELTSRIKTNLFVVDELPNCLPAVRAQLFNLFDGTIEIDGRLYRIGGGYSVGIATGNIGQQFTESSNELGRALKDRMHVIIDTDYFKPRPRDTFEMDNSDPRVKFDEQPDNLSSEIIKSYETLRRAEVPLEKRLIKEYLLHGLDYVNEKFVSKTAMKSGWPNKIEGNEAGSDEALILPVSIRAGKSIMSLSQALDQIVSEKGGNTAYEDYYFDSMMAAFKFVGAYSGILNEAAVRNNFDENRYAAMDAVIAATDLQFKGGEHITGKKDSLAAVIHMINSGKTSQKVLNEFSGRWSFMKDLAEYLAEKKKNEKRQT